jgi:hypothetical protein
MRYAKRARRPCRQAKADCPRERLLLIDGPSVLGWHAWRALDLEFGLGLLRRDLGAAAAAGQLRVTDVETTTHLLAGALIDGAMVIGQNPHDASLRRSVEATVLRFIQGLAGTSELAYPADRRPRGAPSASCRLLERQKVRRVQRLIDAQPPERRRATRCAI